MVDDRHTDAEAIPFSTVEKALEYAQKLYEFYIDGKTLYNEMGVQDTPDSWLYYAIYSTEGDCIWVVEQELDREINANP